ncbi:metal ABC transporter permease [Thermosyntropha sp.]|uniref:metal ABC transporter permease n=1 Tax=Thermosyntropha sp. TaxID=2740820 RepID=UPI0025E2064B|nr:metal ABC transporter permease [Thermosyntropha sp.]MBO8158228.1 metal ABC transporter permease [Thermosyntropha sp.]
MYLLQYDFIRHALLAGILVSIACGIVGTYVVIKRIVFISGSIAHIAYGGIGLGYFLGINPLWGAFAFTTVSALGMGMISYKAKQKEDTIIGIMWAVGMAIGIILVQQCDSYTADLMSYLFGNILMVPVNDLIFTGILDIIIIAIVYYYFEEFKAVSFDEEFARSAGIKTERFYILLLLLVALTVVVMIRAVGIILVIALLTIPPTIARQYTQRLGHMMFLAVILGIIFTTGGLYFSFCFNLPSGATIILLSAASFFISLSLQKLKNHMLNLMSGKNSFYEKG